MYDLASSVCQAPSIMWWNNSVNWFVVLNTSNLSTTAGSLSSRMGKLLQFDQNIVSK
jgi:hypothetical protein